MTSTLRSPGTVLAALCCFIGHTHVADAQELNLVPRFVRQGIDPRYPTAYTFLDACLNFGQWAYVKSVTSYLGYWDNLNDTDNASLAACFQNMNATGLQLSIEAGAWAPGCSTGENCFRIVQPKLQALVSLGAPPILVRMLEPFTTCLFTPGCDSNYVADQVAVYMQLMRNTFPGIRIVDLEGYPDNNYSRLSGYMSALAQSTSRIATPMPQYFELDHDWQRSDWNFNDIRDLYDLSHSYGMAFGVVFWNSTVPENETLDSAWFCPVNDQGQLYSDAGVVLDMYTIESWRYYIPHDTIPEDTRFTFMDTARAFRANGYFPR
jgi:hypothetical protein